jgi:hypothetical protein
MSKKVRTPSPQGLDPGESKVHLPPNIPAKNFWSLMVYDNQTRSELQTDQQYPSLGSQKKDLVINPDKSVDSAHPTGTSIERARL